MYEPCNLRHAGRQSGESQFLVFRFPVSSLSALTGNWKPKLELQLETGFQSHRLEWNHHHRLESHCSAVLCSGPKVPAGQGGARILIELVVYAAQDPNVAH